MKLNKANALLVSIAASTLVLAACHGSGVESNPITNAQVAAKERDLQGGTFESESCDLAPIEAATSLFAVKAFRTQYSIKGANVTRSTVYYERADCSGEPAFTFNEHGKIAAINPDERTADGGKTIDFEFINVTLQTSDAEGVAIANKMKVCDVVDWAPNQDRDVTAVAGNTNCLRSKLPTKEYNIYRIDNNALLLGIPGAQASSRPTSLNSRRFVSKK